MLERSLILMTNTSLMEVGQRINEHLQTQNVNAWFSQKVLSVLPKKNNFLFMDVLFTNFMDSVVS